jgi:hypothetical protein
LFFPVTDSINRSGFWGVFFLPVKHIRGSVDANSQATQHPEPRLVITLHYLAALEFDFIPLANSQTPHFCALQLTRLVTPYHIHSSDLLIALLIWHPLSFAFGVLACFPV